MVSAGFFGESSKREQKEPSLLRRDGSLLACQKKQGGRQRPQTALCGPPRVSAAKPCATLVLGYALHGFQPFLALVGLRPPLVAGFGLR